jgi:hypothetical protein
MTLLGDPPAFSVPDDLHLIRAHFATPLEERLRKGYSCVDSVLIEEAVHEACRLADKYRAKYDPARSKFFSWLYAIAHRIFLGRLRRAAHAAQPEPLAADTGGDESESVMSYYLTAVVAGRPIVLFGGCRKYCRPRFGEAIERKVGGSVDPGKRAGRLTLFRIGAPRHFLSQVANRFCDLPARNLTLVGVTGTNGKTASTFLLRAMARQAGIEPGLAGTTEYWDGSVARRAGQTMPESLESTVGTFTGVDRAHTPETIPPTTPSARAWPGGRIVVLSYHSPEDRVVSADAGTGVTLDIGGGTTDVTLRRQSLAVAGANGVCTNQNRLFVVGSTSGGTGGHIFASLSYFGANVASVFGGGDRAYDRWAPMDRAARLSSTPASGAADTPDGLDNVEPAHSGHAGLPASVRMLDLEPVAGVLLDFGVSLDQLTSVPSGFAADNLGGLAPGFADDYVKVRLSWLCKHAMSGIWPSLASQFEPGSSFKRVVYAVALESPDSSGLTKQTYDVSSEYSQIGKYKIHDLHRNGVLGRGRRHRSCRALSQTQARKRNEYARRASELVSCGPESYSEWRRCITISNWWAGSIRPSLFQALRIAINAESDSATSTAGSAWLIDVLMTPATRWKEAA